MIIGYIGAMGSGKTLSMVKEAWQYYKDGYTVYSNMNLEFPFIPLDYERLKQFANEDKPFYNCVVVIDEIHTLLDSRRSMSERNLILSYFVTQTRKQKVKLLYTTQRINQVEIRLRQNSSLIIFCESIKIPYNQKELIIITNNINSDKGILPITFLANPYFGLYDTEELIIM